MYKFDWISMCNTGTIDKIVDNKANGSVLRLVFQGNKACQIFLKTDIFYHHMTKAELLSASFMTIDRSFLR